MHPIPGNPGNEQPGQGAPGPHLHPIFEMLMHFMANRAFPGTARQGRCGAVPVWWWDYREGACAILNRLRGLELAPPKLRSLVPSTSAGATFS
jgi:hypothetical protein